eukprot:CAMPEP_0182422646 /NCGR_PEP_ID=MMETSP1167-20130531/8380_1 /TAXON_ID=2988 /ORGANISM="Mallomonas Sp, Strain CCMP3275" /LENGTH=289 /DNA_ID=CAMNT_0024600861 /DNA_START=196 /DNA_END=1061 /DNA_ORIENTATION=+
MTDVTAFKFISPIARNMKSCSISMVNEYETLSKIKVKSVNGKEVLATSLISPSKITLMAFLTHFADFNSWELAQRLKHDLEKLKSYKIEVICIGIGSPEAASLFSELLDFPADKLFSDEQALCHRALGFSRGPFPNTPVSPMLKLGLMLGGIGSPGTIQAVLGGYFGSKDRESDGGVGNWIDSAIKQGARKGRFPTEALGQPLSEIGAGAWDTLGTTGLRPFELATLRLQNMLGGIGDNWKELAPKDTELVIQQGGSVVFKGKSSLYRYDDKGILTYTPVDEALSVVMS